MTTPEIPKENPEEIEKKDDYVDLLEWTQEEEEEFLRILNEDTFKDL